MGKSARKSGKSSAPGGGKLAQYQPQRTTAEARATRPAATGPIPSDAMAVPDRSLNRIQVGNRRFPAEQSTLGTRKLDILPDMPDIRDRIYRPILRALEPAIYPRIAFSVRDQGKDSSCTGFALAHVVDFLRFREIGPDNPQRASARMLYEMAKRNDEWAGSAYEGSSIRGAITGFFRNGVCREATAPDSPEVKNWSLTYEMAKGRLHRTWGQVGGWPCLRDRRLRRQGLLDSQFLGSDMGHKRYCALALCRLGRQYHGRMGSAARRTCAGCLRCRAARQPVKRVRSVWLRRSKSKRYCRAFHQY